MLPLAPRSSPTPFHVEQILAAVERGKHVFCEKPISNELPEIDNCIKVRAWVHVSNSALAFR
jgi:predicted dehydrogenase